MYKYGYGGSIFVMIISFLSLWRVHHIKKNM